MSNQYGFKRYPEEWEDFKKWAKYYKKSLEMLEGDLELISKYNCEIIVSLDFYDIFEHCFPFERRTKDKTHILRREIGRWGLLSHTNMLYEFPILLLPPYLEECIEFITLSERIDNKKDFKSEIDYIYEIFAHFDTINEMNSKELLDSLCKVAPDLVFLFSPNFYGGIDLFKNLMRNCINPKPDNIVPGLFMDYINVVREINEQDPNQFMKLMRGRKNKNIQNYRDAKAIQYVIELNEKINDNIIILFSGANFMKSLINTNKFNKNIGGKNYSILRNTDFLYIALLEILSFMSKNNISMDDFKAEDLLLTIKSELEMLNEFLVISEKNYSFSDYLSGCLNEEYIYDALIKMKKFKIFIENRQNINLINMMEKSQSTEDIQHLMKYVKYSDRDYINTLNLIKESIQTGEFLEVLSERMDLIEAELETLSTDMKQLVGEIDIDLTKSKRRK